jgi:hypothetical protein
MFFKPKIFISSVLSLKTIRSEIDLFLRSVGAEVIIYEKNLTPSTIRATYRSDILESDFVILILDKEYGTLTKHGKSGTHEEYDILIESNIPFHVYIRKSNNHNRKLNSLINKFTFDDISYYFYVNHKDLLARIKETVFTISKEIALNQIERFRITNTKILKITTKRDYDRGVKILKDIHKMTHFLEYNNIDPRFTTAYSFYFEYWSSYYKAFNWYFIDYKIDEMFKNVIIKCDEYHTLLSSEFSPAKEITTVQFEDNIEFTIHKLNQDHIELSTSNIELVFNEFINSLNFFEKELDLHNKRASYLDDNI